jgi:hypothetical protein
MKWINVKDKLPSGFGYAEEVLVWIDGHRSPSFSNNHATVAYQDGDGNWHSYYTREPLAGIVVAWMPLPKPPKIR